MANLFDSPIVTSVGNTPTLLYTPATDIAGLSLLLNNGYYGTLPVTVWIVRGSDTIYLAKNHRVRKGDTFDAFWGSKVVLKAGDQVYAQCPYTGAFTGIISAYKDS